MSPLYMPRKRKPVLPKSCAPCPVVQRVPGRVCDVAAICSHQNDESESAEVVRMKRMLGRKRYEDLQSVSVGNPSEPATSSSMMSSDGLANGSQSDSVAPPSTRPPPQRPEGDDGPELDTWAQGPDQVWDGNRGRVWGTSRDEDLAWAEVQRGVSEQGWQTGRDQDQTQNQGQNTNSEQSPGGEAYVERQKGWGPKRVQVQNWSNSSTERGDVWTPDVRIKKLQKASVVSDSSHPAEGSSCCPGEVAQTSTASICLEKKPQVPPARREPPTYPAGSPEERWQMQIVARGRVTCPKCKSVSRKTVEGLKKHMENCRLQPFTCQHCGKQLKSSTGMKYHIMADHSHLPSLDDVSKFGDRDVKDKLRRVLKRLGKLKCSKEGCGAAFGSIMGYVYHMRKCGKEEAELEKMLLRCSHCGKSYKSKAGLEYHLKSEHAPTPQKTEDNEDAQAGGEVDPGRTASGRVQRASAQLANFHLAEIANNDLPKDWPKRKFQSDLVPDDQKLKYARPGLPAFSQEVLRKWKNEVKLQRKVQCPNQGCSCTYTSVSGLKAHLGLCTRGDFEAGKYRCLICNKEFNSESGVKYHINSVHSQEWFVTNKKASKKFEKFLKNQPKEFVLNMDKQSTSHLHHHHHHYHHHHQLQQQQQHYQHHHHHHHHAPLPQQLQPLQPLHHLQHQTQFLHSDRPCHLHQGEPPLLYTPLEPPAVAMWVEMEQREDVPGPEQAPIEMELAVMDKEEGEEEEEEEGSQPTAADGET